MKLNLRRLESIAHTLQAIENIDQALEWHKENLPGPAYMTVKNPKGGAIIELQFDREHFREFMTQRKRQLIQHLEGRFDGFEYDPEASWTGDKKPVDHE